METRSIAPKLTILALLGYFLFSPSVLEAQFVMPLYVGPPNTHPILDEFGEIIRGHSSTPEISPLVQVLWATNGVIHPPNPDGTPHPDNPLVAGGETRIGALASPALERPGVFAAALVNPRPTSGLIFVRVYNEPTIEESLFYGDSQILTISAHINTLWAYITATDTPIDPTRDTDGDGLPDTWEHLHFGHATAADANTAYGDGPWTARMAFIAGTDPFNHREYSGIRAIHPVYRDQQGRSVRDINAAKDSTIIGHVIEWPGVDGRLYDVEYSTNLVTGFQPIPDATGLRAKSSGKNNTYTHVTTQGNAAYYRVRIRLPSE